MHRVSTNKIVLSSRQNSVRQMSCCRSSTGRLFHSRVPATPKLLSPSLDCVRGTIHVWTSADRRCRRPTSVTSWQSSDRYGGAYTGLKSSYCLSETWKRQGTNRHCGRTCSLHCKQYESLDRRNRLRSHSSPAESSLLDTCWSAEIDLSRQQTYNKLMFTD